MEHKTRFAEMTRRSFLTASGALALGSVAPMALSREGTDKNGLAQSTKGMVTSPHELATQAGQRVLQEGGNAIEAAVAIAACLNVTYPHFSGFGGDGFMIISDSNGKVRTLSGIGQAPAVLPQYGNSIPVRGAASMLTTAANVDTLGKAFDISRNELGGKRSWAELLTPAIGLARNGFPVTPSERFWMDFRQKELTDLPAIAHHFMQDGKAPEIGATFRQPQLADTLETLAARGYRDFYEGQLAERIARGLREAGSPITASDLAKTQARVEAPLQVAYRDGFLLANQPPTQGMTTLEIMGILNQFDLRKMREGSADYYHLLVEAVKQAFIDRNRYVADPEFVDVPVAKLLSTEHLKKRAQAIDMKKALAWPHVFRTGDTVFIGAADAYGNAVSMLQTVYFDWGSGVMAGDTGILWHNRGASFSLKPGHPNELKPGKRPFHTLNPGMFMQNGKPRILYGTQGADGQPQTLTAILTRMIDYGLDPYTALSKPRFLLGKTFSDTRDTLKLEQDAGEEVFAELAKRGHEISTLPVQSPLSGHPGAIVIDASGKKFSGAHDPRSDGRALAV
ncbi:MAG: gamma-glutamyltransferase [Oxalicibacterium faecigallinarum]|uniref:gamma-glutamyltransferase n=1 Tax=Oxalicibacterium faecigallinarum TaxID=573741 RepID=UPI002808A5B5|nr:gamma-glutamyltransferase [Oxalicibacterium faecigallinarum]MDQ7968855.1 gamma-glutamyltransferase [Oxalicibacterium faecigallinarum]